MYFMTIQTYQGTNVKIGNMCDNTGSDGKTFRERFHFRGQSNRYKLGSSDAHPTSPNSCLLKSLKSPIRARHEVNCTSEGQRDGSPSAKDDTPTCVTPTISQRKLLLSRQRKGPQDRTTKSLLSTPGLDRVKAAIRDKVDRSHISSSFKLESDGGSPGLMQLRLTPGRPLKEKQKVLAEKHDETRRNADALNIGGGISLWPGMEDMRLRASEFIQLCLISFLLLLATCSMFQVVHGSTLRIIDELCADVRLFTYSHPIDLNSSYLLSATSLHWHNDFINLTAKIKGSFITIAYKSSPNMFYMCSVLYISGISILLYYLFDNMTSSNKLSPNRIRKWVYLLVIIGVWTINLVRLISGAFMLELSIEGAIEALSEQQRLLAYYTYNTQTYDHVMRYWTLKYLSPTSPGILTILDVIQFKTLLYYMQYYSVPILTALLSPIIKLIIAVLHVYGLVEVSDPS
ncbi:uncharacterized protein [Watersipora subatra]|uniref:uncharacterized protein isoform X2 n=1 Tax=Watersipora subatra TaxID=2589382 RepID=UPI00355B2307